MVLAAIALLLGLALLVWSADRFIEGSAESAAHLGVPPLLIGVIVVGFGTSAPEMVVSAIAAVQDKPAIALGNAYGSNIANIGLILGATALLAPIAVHSQVLRREMPVLLAVTLLAAVILLDGRLGRVDALVLLAVFAAVLGWSVRQGLRERADAFGAEMEEEIRARDMPLGRALLWLAVGLLALIGSSRLLVWGAVEIADEAGVSDLVIGLTVVAAGTSLPEFAASILSVRKGEHDIALGNILGSNLFNTLAVVGIAGLIAPADVASEVLERDVLAMGLMTAALFVVAYGFRGPGRINRFEGGALLAGYCGYTAYLVATAV